MVISEKHPQDEVLDISPSKKGKSMADSNGKGAMSKVTSSKVPSKGAVPIVAPREGTLANPGNVLGLNASMLKNPIMAKKLLEGVILPFNRDEVSKLDLDRAISRLFHGID